MPSKHTFSYVSINAIFCPFFVCFEIHCMTFSSGCSILFELIAKLKIGALLIITNYTLITEIIVLILESFPCLNNFPLKTQDRNQTESFKNIPKQS